MFRLKSALLGNNVPPELMPTLAEGEAAHGDSPLPTTGMPQDSTAPPVPHWIRELNNTAVGRHSRASSIVSTRTRFSTTTLQDDARSINISVAGQYFRINRDGSRVTVDAPPPYSGPTQANIVEVVALDPLSPTPVHQDQTIPADDSDSEDGSRTPRSIIDVSLDNHFFTGLQGDEQSVRSARPEYPIHQLSSATIVGHVRDSALLPTEDDSIDDDDRQDGIFVMQQTSDAVANLPPGDQLVQAVSSPSQSAGSKQRTWVVGTMNPMSASSSTSSPICPHVPLLQRIGLSRSTSRAQPSLPAMTGSQEELPQPSLGALHQSLSRTSGPAFAPVDTESQSSTQLDVAHSPSDEGKNRSHSPLSVDTENEMNMHYAKMMRKLDYEYRKALHLKDKELADMRVRLHEKDTVLRQQVRAKEFMIDDLKQRLHAFEENLESMLQKARNQVEDLWESRWKDRDFHLRERMKRIEDEAQRRIDQLRAETPAPATNSDRPDAGQ